jgi:hypothetical protein
MKFFTLIFTVILFSISEVVFANDTKTSDAELSINTSFQLFPPTLNTNLILPPCEWIDEKTCLRTAEQEDIILEIYLGYTIAMIHRTRIESMFEFDNKIIELSRESLVVAQMTIEDQSVYNDHLMEQYEKCYKEVDKERRKRVLRNILWGGGGTIVGAAIGVAIYALATH